MTSSTSSSSTARRPLLLPSSSSSSSFHETTGSPLYRSVASLGRSSSRVLFGQQGETRSSAFSLASCTLGAGLLTLPCAFSLVGVGVALAGMMAGALINGYCCYLLALCCVRTSSASYEAVALAALGPSATIFCVPVFIVVLFGVLSSQLIVVGDCLVAALASWCGPEATAGAWWASREYLTACAVVMVVGPLSLQKDVSSLRFTSALAIMAVTGLLAFLVVFSVRGVGVAPGGAAAVLNREGFLAMDTTAPDSWIAACTAANMIFFSFAAQAQVPPIYEGLKERSALRMRAVIVVASITCVVLYCGVGIFGCLSFPNVSAAWPLNGDILAEFRDKDPSTPNNTVNVLRVVMATTMCLTAPLILLPCRSASLQFVRMIHSMCCAGGGDTESSGDRGGSGNRGGGGGRGRDAGTGRGRQSQQVQLDDPLRGVRDSVYDENGTTMGTTRGGCGRCGRCGGKERRESLVRYLITCILLGSAVVVGLVIPSLGVVVTLTASTGGVLLLYIFPVWFYLRLRMKGNETGDGGGKTGGGGGGGSGSGSSGKDGGAFTRRRGCDRSWALPVCVAVIAAIVGTMGTVACIVQISRGVKL